MRIGSLFSGAGGLDMAVEQVFGGTTVWHSEIDKAASKVLAHRWPGVPNLGDITTVDWSEVPAVDILCGGFPCQDVSAAGRRAGIKDGTRSGLWAVFADAIDHLRPPVVVIENVRGLLSATAHRMEPGDTTVGNGAGRPVLRAAGAVLGDLADLGYDAQWATVAAADIGAPHRRERVFIVATAASSGELQRRGGRRAVAGTASRSQGAAEQRQRDGDAVECGGATAPDSGGAAVTLLPTPAAADGQRGQDFARAGRDGSGGDDLVTLVVKATQGGLLLGQAREMATAWGKYEPAIRRWEHLTGPAPAPTEPNAKGNPRLSAAFSQWLMGWPDGWVTDPAIGLSRNDQLRIIGNGVCSQQCVAALRYLLSFAAVTA
jgi:DNA (cytosine-5)-methyltransferase 1